MQKRTIQNTAIMMKNCRQHSAYSLIWLAASIMLALCVSCNKEKPYSLSIQDNRLYITMPHPTIGIVGVNEISWRGVDLDGLTNDIYTTLKKQHLSDIYSIYVKFETTSTDKYGNEEKSYKEAFLFEVPVEELKKYKDSKYFGNSYDLIGKLREAAFTNNASIELSPDGISVKFHEDTRDTIKAGAASPTPQQPIEEVSLIKNNPFTTQENKGDTSVAQPNSQAPVIGDYVFLPEPPNSTK